MKTQTVWKTIAAAVLFLYFTACAPVKFDKQAEQSCGSNGVACIQRCTGTDCILSYAVEKTVGEAMVDILVVNDNSGSMDPEQRKMGAKFPTFLQSLGSADYRIAMTTTDVSSTFSSTPAGVRNDPDGPNQYGALQDGNLIPFGSAGVYLTRNTPSKEALFNSTVERQETINCGNSGFSASQCPSSDERGIFATNLVLDRTASQFMRPNGHLAVIVLSDEDERGVADLRHMYPIENYDRPDTLVNNFKAKYPGKTLSVHSIIVKPGDTGCYNAQVDSQRHLRGEYGYHYANLSGMTGGKVHSICSSDYGALLTDIGYYIQDQVTSLAFACRPINDQFNVTFTPQPTSNIDVTADFAKLELRIEDPLPANTKVRLTYQCTKPE